MRNKILRTALIPILLAIAGIHTRKRKRSPSPLPANGQVTSQNATRNRAIAARVNGASTPSPGTTTTSPSTTSSNSSNSKYKPDYTFDQNRRGRVTQMRVTLKKGTYTPESTNTRHMKSKPKGVPFGFEKNKGFARSHWLGAQLGGTNHTDVKGTNPKDYYNFGTLYGPVNNAPYMRGVEDDIANAVQNHGKEITYTVTPNYDPNDPNNDVPLSVRLQAESTDGTFKIDTTYPNKPDIRQTTPPHVSISRGW